MAGIITTKAVSSLWSRTCCCGRLTNDLYQAVGNPRNLYGADFIWHNGRNHLCSKPQTSKKWKFRLRWLVLPTFVSLGYYSYREMTKLKDQVAKEWQVNMYKLLPLNLLSRAWGRMHNVQLPVWMRTPVYKLYIRTFKVDMEEPVIKDLKQYKNLGEFFKRRIKSTSRPIDQTHSLISPCDGKVLHFGKVEGGWVEQVKGVRYSLPAFLGPSNGSCVTNGNTNRELRPEEQQSAKSSEVEYEKSIKCDQDRCLYHCVIYLAPGDYHGFHSPAEWVVSLRRHFPGKLLSVNPRVASKVRGLFNLNERAVYMGQWEQGLLAMAAVGATNVGSIKVYFDKSLHTNPGVKHPKGYFLDEQFTSANDEGILFHKGESFGEFNLGSTIVLIFEAPETFTFKVANEQKIKLGQPIGHIKS